MMWINLFPSDRFHRRTMKCISQVLEGPEGAHQVRNDSDEPIRVLILSTKGEPNAAVYPDSGKIGVWTGNDEADPPRLFRIGTELDYWDGES